MRLIWPFNKKNKTDKNKIFVIAESGCSHDGNLNFAHQWIKIAKEIGADAIKFQTHIAEAESTISEKFRIPFSVLDKTRKEYWNRMEFSKDEWIGLKRHCEESGLIFMSSPFSIEACELLKQIGLKIWKIGSGELTNIPMLEFISKTRLPVILSTGMSTWQETDQAFNLLKNSNPLAILQCTSSYPCPPKDAGMNVIQEIKKRYDCLTGYSAHSNETTQCLMAAALGADIIEFHLSLSPFMFGPDVSSSLSPEQAKYMIKQIRDIELMQFNKIDKNCLTPHLKKMRQCFHKSIVAKQDIPSGTLITDSLLSLKKPGIGIPAHDLQKVLGKRNRRFIPKDTLISMKNLY